MGTNNDKTGYGLADGAITAAKFDQSTAYAANEAIVNYNLDHLCKTPTGSADMTNEVADNTIISRIISNGDTSVFDPSTDGLQPIRDRGDDAWVTGGGGSAEDIADAVWDEPQSEHTTAGTFGYYLDAQISGVGGAVGSGSKQTTHTITDENDNPIEGAAVWISTDEEGNNIVAGTLYTNTNGQVQFMLDDGDYYRWVQKGGYTFDNPTQFTVS